MYLKYVQLSECLRQLCTLRSDLLRGLAENVGVFCGEATRTERELWQVITVYTAVCSTSANVPRIKFPSGD